MRVTMCDSCKKVFKPYSFFLDDDGNKYEGNMFTIVNFERDGKMHSKFRAELCPDCNFKLRSFLEDELGLKTTATPHTNRSGQPDTLGTDGELAASADPDDVPVSGGEVEGA